MRITKVISPGFLKFLFIIVCLTFITIVVYSYSTGITGLTRKTGGQGCYCHNGAPSPGVTVIISGPDTVAAGDSAVFTVSVTGGPLVRAGTDIAVSRGVLSLIPLEGLKKVGAELTHNAPKAPFGNTVTFSFMYKAPMSTGKDTLFANGNSINFNNSNTGDQWNFAENKIVTVKDPIGIINLSTEAKSFSLRQNYPNPFNPETNIRFSISGKAYTELNIYNAAGELIAGLVGRELNAGEYEVSWNAAELPSGVYYYTLSAGSYTETRKMVLVK